MALERWTIDPAHSILGFRVRHLMIANVHGRFESWGGTIDFDPDAPTQSHARLRIEAASLDTREPQRDGHLRSAEFLDAERFPDITFESTRIEAASPDDYQVTGEMTIRGTTRTIVLAVSRSAVVRDHAGRDRVGFAVTGAISRKDFGLTWNYMLETGGVMVGDRVTIDAELEAVRAQMPAEAP